MISLYSETLADADVPDGEEWHIQRTKLLQNVHDAVKQVQDYLTTLPEISTPLQIRDSPAQNLCKLLDLIFLHGLKNIAGGYWQFVKEFTHKDAIENILEMHHVRTNIGRGRAWLYTALNESLLECYFRAFATNSVLISRFYTQNAFFKDYQKLETLTMLTAGLEFAVFQLERDIWFLDQTPVPPDNEDALKFRKETSLSSISLSSSILSQQSCASMESTSATSHDADSGFETMESSQLNQLDGRGLSRLPQIRMDERIARIVEMNFAPSENVEKTEDGMETVEVVTRTVRRKKKKPARTNNGIKSHSRNNSATEEVISSEMTTIKSTETDTNFAIKNDLKKLSDDKINIETELSSDCSTLSEKSTKLDCIEMKPAIKLREKSGEKKNPAKRVSFEIDLVANDVNMNFYSASSSESASETPVNEKEPTEPSMTVEKSIYDGNCDCKKTKCFRTIYNGLSFELDEIEANDQCRKFDETMKEEMSRMTSEEPLSYCIKVDNNTKLKLILSVFREDDEQLFKMFHASIGQSDDEMKLVFPVLTDRRMYLIEHGLCQRHYFISRVIKYEELDYLLVGLNYQTICFVCKQRRKRYTLSTGDENLSRDIISNLEVAVRRHSCGNYAPSVFTDSKMQLIGLQKWIATETNIERHEVDIVHYVFVHWEDPLSISLNDCPAGPSKQGCLMYRFHYHENNDGLSETCWTPGYFVLRAGVLYQFSIEEDSHKLQTYIRLHTPDFQGCRKVTKSNRPHVFELKLDVGRVLYLAAADDYEASQWMQTLLKTVSLKVITDNIHPFKSCCLVLTSEKLLVCQEDLDLFNYTTLGSADLINLTKIQVDVAERKYCILEFETMEANVFAGDWVLYFNTEYEFEKFSTALSNAWEMLMQIPITKTEITNKSIQENCRDRVMMLENSWKLGYDMIREPMSIIDNFPSPK